MIPFNEKTCPVSLYYSNDITKLLSVVSKLLVVNTAPCQGIVTQPKIDPSGFLFENHLSNLAIDVVRSKRLFLLQNSLLLRIPLTMPWKPILPQKFIP